jgi:hypothetical protein
MVELTRIFIGGVDGPFNPGTDSQPPGRDPILCREQPLETSKLIFRTDRKASLLPPMFLS